MIPTSENTVIDIRQPVCIDPVQEPLLRKHGVRLGMLRLDKLHPEISGNKWFKLKENLRLAKEGRYNSILTFGGAYSNHLAATAAAAARLSLKAVGVVRGLHGAVSSSPTLDFCREQGMILHFVSREEYNLKQDAAYLHSLDKTFGHPYIIPEGGNNDAGRSGCEAIAACIPEDASHVALPVGTGTTFCGIRRGLKPSVGLHGFPAMKGGAYLEETIANYLPGNDNSWRLHTDYHFGGFARYTGELINFMNGFYRQHHIKLDFVYTAKLFFGIFDLVGKGFFEQGAYLIGIHTGGLQGNASVRDKLTF